MRGIGELGAELRELQLTFADSRTVVQLPPLSDGLATDVYMSREHANAQEQSIVIKGLLVTMLPTCKVPYRLCRNTHRTLRITPARYHAAHVQGPYTKHMTKSRSTSMKTTTTTPSTSRSRSITLHLPYSLTYCTLLITPLPTRSRSTRHRLSWSCLPRST